MILSNGIHTRIYTIPVAGEWRPGESEQVTLVTLVERKGQSFVRIETEPKTITKPGGLVQNQGKTKK